MPTSFTPIPIESSFTPMPTESSFTPMPTESSFTPSPTPCPIPLTVTLLLNPPVLKDDIIPVYPYFGRVADFSDSCPDDTWQPMLGKYCVLKSTLPDGYAPDPFNPMCGIPIPPTSPPPSEMYYSSLPPSSETIYYSSSLPPSSEATEYPSTSYSPLSTAYPSMGEK